MKRTHLAAVGKEEIKMPLKIPKIDDRNYQQIVNEALVRIPVHNPEWTNFNDSDPGITLIQLFAFMSESLLYRSNLIPERNRIKFLKLLGVPVQPASAAKGIVTFSNLKGEIKTEALPNDLEVRAGQVSFRTLDGIDALPIEAKVYYKKTVTKDQISAESANLYLQLYAGFQEGDKKTETKFYETRQLEAPVSGAEFPVVDLSNPADIIDGSLWVALLARKKGLIGKTTEEIANKVLTIGILPSLTGAVSQVLPAGPISTERQPEFIFHIPKGEKFTAQQVRRNPRYQALKPKVSGNLQSEPGVVHLTLPGKDDIKLWENLEPLEAGTGDFPPSLEDTEIQDRLVTWIRIRVKGFDQPQSAADSTNSTDGTSSQLQARVSWVGVNAARVEQYTHVVSESPGTGTGAPDQTVTLANIPVLPDNVKLTVNGETWQKVEDLMTAAPEVPVRNTRQVPGTASSAAAAQDSKVFTVDRESGEIRFGDGLRGTRPPVNAVIRVSYDYGGGTQGNVGIGTINKSSRLSNGIKVTNEIPTWGGAEAESTAEAEKHIAGYLRHRDRLVSMEDFQLIAKRTPGVAPGRVEVLPLFHPDPHLQNTLSEGVVTLMVIPQEDVLHPDNPEPDRLFLDTICDYLDPRRLVTTELHVIGPEYVPIWVSIGIEVVPGTNVPPVREDVIKAIKKFLSPLNGGFEGKGWPLDKTVENLEIWAKATQVKGVSKVNNVLLSQDDGLQADRVELKGLQLPRIMGLSVDTGDPKPLEQLQAETGVAVPTADIQPEEIFPVPVIPSECK